jgi:hypothetical protein
MNKHLKHLAAVLLGLTLVLAAPDGKDVSKNNVENNVEKNNSVERLGAKAKPKPLTDGSAFDGKAPKADFTAPSSAPNIIEVRQPYSVDLPPKETPSSSFWQSGNLVLILSVSGGLLLLIALWLMLRGDKPKAVTHNATQNASLVATDVQQLSQAIFALNGRLNVLATAANVTNAQTSINSNFANLERTLVPKVADAAVAAMSKSELGELRLKLSSALSNFEKAKLDLNDKDSQLGMALEGSKIAKNALITAQGENKISSDNLTRMQGEIDRLKRELEDIQILVKSTEAKAVEQKVAADLLRTESTKGYEVLAPAKLNETSLGVQVHALYQESMAGNAASIAAWTTLTAFVSAQADPLAKDFQLQIVRRLGVTLVSYWKHQGHTEKDRHDRLVDWAKSLNEHADGRYNLLVPSLGEPIDRSRMSCATSVTVIREVLCWQVRNPLGANFSLAEVA